jgi:hypothetical protein
MSMGAARHIPGISPHALGLGDSAVIAPVLLAALALGYLKIRRISVRQAVMESGAPFGVRGLGRTGRVAGPGLLNAVTDRPGPASPAPWPGPPTSGRTGGAGEGAENSSWSGGKTGRPNGWWNDTADEPADEPENLPENRPENLPADNLAHPSPGHRANPVADPRRAFADAVDQGPDRTYFLPERPYETAGPASLYQGSEGIANALEASWAAAHVDGRDEGASSNDQGGPAWTDAEEDVPAVSVWSSPEPPDVSAETPQPKWTAGPAPIWAVEPPREWTAGQSYGPPVGAVPEPPAGWGFEALDDRREEPAAARGAKTPVGWGGKPPAPGGEGPSADTEQPTARNANRSPDRAEGPPAGAVPERPAEPPAPSRKRGRHRKS